jgi:hypothetical protein
MLCMTCAKNGATSRPLFFLLPNRNEEGHSDSVAEMLMSQLFGKSVSTSAPSPQSFPDSTCQTEFTDIVGGDLNDGRQAGQQAKTPKHCQKKCQGRGPNSRALETKSYIFPVSYEIIRRLKRNARRQEALSTASCGSASSYVYYFSR